MILRGMVPQAMGRMRPLGLSSGIMRAEARALRVVESTLLVASRVKVSVRAARACGLEATTPKCS